MKQEKNYKKPYKKFLGNLIKEADKLILEKREKNREFYDLVAEFEHTLPFQIFKQRKILLKQDKILNELKRINEQFKLLLRILRNAN